MTGRPDEMSDEELLAAVVARRARGWEAFHARFNRVIVGCIRKTLARYTAYVSEDDVADITSTVLLNLVKDDFRRLRAFDATRGYRLSSWVGLIATNTCLDALRRREPRHASLDQDGPDAEPMQVADPAPDAASEVAQVQEHRALLRAIAALPGDDRAFFDLVYETQIPADEIARRLGISVNTVYSRKNRLRDKLQQAVRSLEPRKVRSGSA